MELLRGNADLGTEAELSAVDEPARGVDQDGGRIHLGGEALGGGEVGRDDGLRVTCRVCTDVVEGGIQVGNDRTRQVEAQVLLT